MLIDLYDAFLLDLDGVLYRGDEPIPRAADTIRAVREAGRSIAFVTNNSSATPKAVVDRLARVGVKASPAEVETSALSTAALLAGRGARSAFVVGEEGVRSALRDAGIEVVENGGHGTGAPVVDVVVVGFDRSADYERLKIASLAVDAGASLVATNPDGSYPAPDGARWPGAGALMAAIEAATGIRAEVVGKPNPPIFEAALARAGGGRALVVGDRLDTDIEGAAALGWDSLLVLTGISRREDLERAAHRPTYVGDDLSWLIASEIA